MSNYVSKSFDRVNKNFDYNSNNDDFPIQTKEREERVREISKKSLNTPRSSERKLKLGFIKKGFKSLLSKIYGNAKRTGLINADPEDESYASEDTQSSNELSPKDVDLKLKRSIVDFADRTTSSYGKSSIENRVKFDQMLKEMGLSEKDLKNLRKIAVENMIDKKVVKISQDVLEKLDLKDMDVTILPNSNILMNKGDPIGWGAENTVWKGVEIRADKIVWFQNRAVILNKSMGSYQEPELKELLSKLTLLDHICPAPMELKKNDKDGTSLMLLPLYSGGDVGARIGNLSFDDALRVCLGAAVGLNNLDERGVLHRDINPGNIFIRKGDDGNITADIGDLGEACFKGKVEFRGGTPTYSAPEMSPRRSKNNEQTELWALGLTIWQIFYGEKKEEGLEGYFPPFMDELRANIESENRAFDHCITEKLGAIEDSDFIHDGLGFKKPDDKAEELIHNLIKGLLSIDPNERPKIYRVVSVLKKAAEIKGILFDSVPVRKKDRRFRAPIGRKKIK